VILPAYEVFPQGEVTGGAFPVFEDVHDLGLAGVGNEMPRWWCRSGAPSDVLVQEANVEDGVNFQRLWEFKPVCGVPDESSHL
jgi:hypothetical protein